MPSLWQPQCASDRNGRDCHCHWRFGFLRYIINCFRQRLFTRGILETHEEGSKGSTYLSAVPSRQIPGSSRTSMKSHLVAVFKRQTGSVKVLRTLAFGEGYSRILHIDPRTWARYYSCNIHPVRPHDKEPQGHRSSGVRASR